VDYTLVVHFDEARSKEPAEDFVLETLVGCLNVKVVVVGEDFHFGHQRRGDVALLGELGGRHGFDTLGIDLVDAEGQPAGEADRVSSTRIRAALRAGDLSGANHLLGRHHEVRGVVTDGDKRARELGFPTANVSVPDEMCLPRDGIYAGWYLRPDGAPLPAAISLGRRPTFYEHQPYSLLEAHVLDGFDDDLYGEAARVRFVEHLRDEERFDSVEALVDQMARDCDRAARLLGP
jgi:riboflavin kinase/FMN adenylyltransferase